MTSCIIKPESEYVEETPSGTIGIYKTYGHIPELFNLISRTCTIMFMYEPGFEEYPVNKKLDFLVLERALFDSLEQEPVKELLQQDPITMWEEFLKIKPTHLKLMELYNSFENLTTAMYLRVLQYRKYNKGLLSKSGNIRKVKFGSDLTEGEDRFLEGAKKALFKSFLKGSK